MNCGDIEENPGVLDQCYNNNNFVTAVVRIAVDVGGVGDLDFECVTKIDG